MRNQSSNNVFFAVALAAVALGLTGIGGGSGIYDVRGRFFYAGAVAKF